jgi:hypothetical protein
VSYLCWHDEQPNGPLCGLCDQPLRLDEPEPHVCGPKPDYGWVEHALFVLLVAAVGLLTYALAVAHNEAIPR